MVGQYIPIIRYIITSDNYNEYRKPIRILMFGQKYLIKICFRNLGCLVFGTSDKFCLYKSDKFILHRLRAGRVRPKWNAFLYCLLR